MQPRRWQPFLYLLPSLLFIFIFWIISLLHTGRLSIHEASLIGGIGKYVGLQNFRQLFTYGFADILIRTGIWILLTVGISMFLGIGGAFLLNRDIAFRSLLRGLVYIPWVVPESLAAVLWRWLINPSYGMINNILLRAGVIEEGISFLRYDSALYTAIAMRVWRATPFVIISVLAGLQSIPNHVMEAADIDGADGFQKTLYITLPLLRPVLVTSSMLLIIWSAVIFDMLYVLTGGGPAGATTTLPLAIFIEGFEKYHIDSAAAMAVIGLILLTCLTAGYYRLVEKED